MKSASTNTAPPCFPPCWLRYNCPILIEEYYRTRAVDTHLWPTQYYRAAVTPQVQTLPRAAGRAKTDPPPWRSCVQRIFVKEVHACGGGDWRRPAPDECAHQRSCEFLSFCTRFINMIHHDRLAASCGKVSGSLWYHVVGFEIGSCHASFLNRIIL